MSRDGRELPSSRRGAAEKEVPIFIGGVHASAEPIVVTTLLGSCIAVCLFDPENRVGGMNHFMLPDGEGAGPGATRFGVHAMDCLIGALIKVGGERRRFVAKAFGGGHVLGNRQPKASSSPPRKDGKANRSPKDIALDVPEKNIAFVHDFLESEGFPLVAEDMGGLVAREVHFYTATGQAFVRRLTGSRIGKQLLNQERQVPPPRYGGVTLFEQE